MLKNICDIDTVFKKTKTLGNILKHSNRAPTDKLNQQHAVYKIPANALKLTLGNPKEKWERD